MAELDVETLKALEFRRSEVKPHDQGYITVHLAIGRHLPAIIVVLENHDRLRAEFLEYGDHLWTCPAAHPEPPGGALCDCGWDAIKAALEDRDG